METRVYCDEQMIFSTNLNTMRLISPKVSQEVNKVGSFTFSVYPDHPYFALLTKMKPIITAYEEGITEPLFRGRISAMKEGFHNEKQVTCEGELAFLNDSIQRPWSFTGSPEALFRQFIANHNAQVDASRQFTVGVVTVTDTNDYITRAESEYKNTWSEINEKLIKTLGGYLWTRHENGITYIDYLADFEVLSNQAIEFGKNLLDLTKDSKADNFATALIPLGARLTDETGAETGERLTIKSVNNNVDYVYNADAVAIHGYIFATNTWDDVTDATNLMRKGQAYIDDKARFAASLNVSAADLNGATIDGEPIKVNSFRIGRYVKVNTAPHSISNQSFIISKLSRELLKPESTKLTLGATFKTLTEKQSNTSTSAGIAGPAGAPGKDGKGIASTVVTYQAGASGTTAPTGTWQSTIPTVAENQYLWTRTVITYTDSTTSTVYTVGKMGAKGEPGADGKTTYFHIKYSVNANGNPMTETPSTYIGTYVDYTEADSTDYTKYTWARFQGAQGAKGDQGIPGTNGANGQTSYLHIAYATSANGSTGFSVSDSANKTYIGQYTDFTSADSTDYTKYRWTKIKGETGATGPAGKDAAIQSTTAPTDTSYMWLDISVEPPLLKRWNGTEWVVVNDVSENLQLLEQSFSSSIENSEQNLKSTMAENYYTKGETSELVNSVQSSWEQTAQGFEAQFTNMSKNIDDVANGADARFQEISTYIRFTEEGIELGKSDSPLILNIENDRISFKQDNTEVAYFSDNKLYVTDGEYTRSLRLGNFEYTPRSNGNLSFGKIT